MNNFESKYIKIASKYLDDKMKSLNVKAKSSIAQESKKGSRFHKIVSAVFKS
jgi:hypothetical protein